MIPVVVLIGRTNVGKSTIFNCLTKTHDALVSNFPKLTRDRNYGFSKIDKNEFIIIDTGGIEKDNDNNKLNKIAKNQSEIAISESDIILFVVDAKSGLMHGDYEIANYLRVSYNNKQIYLIVNKVDGLELNLNISEFYSLGFKKILYISASHRRGINFLVKNIFSEINTNIKNVTDKEKIYCKKQLSIKIAIIGRPNVGKSTITNCMIGDDNRVIVDDLPGTTRDSIYINFEKKDIRYSIIDTAGIRKKRKIKNIIEKFSVIKSMQSIEKSNVTLLVIDAQTGILDQDLALLNIIINSGKCLIVVINKWDDNLSKDIKNQFKNDIEYRFKSIKFITICFISALYKKGIEDLWKLINKVYNCSIKHISTSKLNKIMNIAIKNHQPPMRFGRKIKLKYANFGGYVPPTIIIHGNQVTNLPESYKRYLKNYFLCKLNIIGTSINIQFKNSLNPFVKKNNFKLFKGKSKYIKKN